ncbi:hypothetical protein LTR97_004681 [Elasticomyces elasticus]|uniref:AB hydrolase-1 domain-containing protein n=1 Tax=Elasticomyces elasticus TaxID=574655 RepID=A0AAN7ZUJ8_9PEZI|nr:hypothetical protein LTR97_004681 [Elasticomyces elasticus]
MAQQFQLPDGRNLDYQISGAKDGFPFVFIHGTPGAYPTLSGLKAVCEKKNVKLITFSRAGYGGSTRHRGRRVIDGVADTKALLEHLGVQECIVGGWSGGGAAPFDGEGLDFLAGQGEDNVEEFRAAMKGEEEIQKFCEAARPGLQQADAAGIVEEMSSILPEVDKRALTENKTMGDDIAASFREAFKVSADGWIDDDLEFVQPWGFDFSEIKTPVYLYQGSEDKMVPFAHGQWLASHLPRQGLTEHLLDGEGHISIFIGREEAMVDELLGVARP